MSLIPSFSPPVIATVSATASSASAENFTSYTFSSLSFGTAQSNRYIIVAAGVGDGDADDRQISGITIGGVAGTEVIHAFNEFIASSTSSAAIYIASVPTGTTGDIVVATSGSGTAGNCTVVVYRATGINPSAIDTASSTSDPASLNVDVVANGIIVACFNNYDNGTVSWTGPTEDYDANAENGAFSSASLAVTTTQSGFAVSADFSAGPAAKAAVCASFRAV